MYITSGVRIPVSVDICNRLAERLPNLWYPKIAL